MSAAGVDYMEMGYKNSKKLFPAADFGVWKFCEDDLIHRVIDGVKNGAKVSVMVDVGRVDMDDVKPKKESPVDMVRVAAYLKDVDKAIHMVNEFNAKGYETTINIMSIASAMEKDLIESLHQIEDESRPMSFI